MAILDKYSSKINRDIGVALTKVFLNLLGFGQSHPRKMEFNGIKQFQKGRKILI